MNTGSLIILLLIGGWLFAMLGMHRGGHAHGSGGSGGCGGHGHSHGGSSSDERGEEKKPPSGTHGSHEHIHDHGSTTAGGAHER